MASTILVNNLSLEHLLLLIARKLFMHLIETGRDTVNSSARPFGELILNGVDPVQVEML